VGMGSSVSLEVMRLRLGERERRCEGREGGREGGRVNKKRHRHSTPVHLCLQLQ
jgi:hypothetical protein